MMRPDYIDDAAERCEAMILYVEHAQKLLADAMQHLHMEHPREAFETVRLAAGELDVVLGNDDD